MTIASRAAGWVACALVLALLSPLFIAAPQADALQAGNPTLTKIGNRVWDDLDGDGILDASERGVPALLVELLDSSGAVVATRTTTVNGYWNMLVDPTQAWQVRVNAPAGRSFTTRGAGNNDQVDSDANAAGIITIAAGTLPPGGEDKSYDTGLAPQAALTKIGNRVWDDLDGDGILDASERGVPALLVELLDSSGAVVATRTTTVNGYWNMLVDPTQAWQVRVNAPAGRSFTTRGAGNNDQVDSDANAAGIITIAAGTLPPGGEDKSYDTGLSNDVAGGPPATIGNRVWGRPEWQWPLQRRRTGRCQCSRADSRFAGQHRPDRHGECKRLVDRRSTCQPGLADSDRGT